MKNQYVGDFNDYVKYAILRALAKHGLPVVLCWMLTPNDESGEGRKLQYLRRPDQYRGFDPALFDRLSQVVADGDRSISAVEDRDLFPGTRFYAGLLDDEQQARQAYFDGLWDSLERQCVVFFDPDNGLPVASRPKGRKLSSKYLYWDEARECSSRGHSLIVFQHFARTERWRYLEGLLDRLRVETGLEEAFAIQSPNVAFLVAAQEEHAEALNVAAGSIARRWNGRIGIVRSPEKQRRADPYGIDTFAV